ncbi:hypothetical protein [Croceicoccus bisphenolivorans]|uniref:hypothetical protein n=1 Tax=Croceicoccus bisphenolivorans TaxID=1783232 RepID=UPI000B02F18E|nr:hypothetical protein [Croceicoccus bisphenolivorans]
MAHEVRPDGSLRFRMGEQPLYQVIVVILVAFGIGVMFLYALTTEQGTEIVIRKFATGYHLPVWGWRILFAIGAAIGIGAGSFILLGLLRGNHPFVRVEDRRIVVGGFAMIADKAMRWDEVAEIKRFRIMGDDAMTLKSKSGKKLQVSAHTFKDKRDFAILANQCAVRVRRAREGIEPGPRPG